MIKTIKDIDLAGKKTLVRVDFNVPLKDGVIGDDTRIKEAVQTIKYAMEHGAKTALISHLGRPKGEKKAEFSLKPVADYINANFFPVKFIDDCIGEKVETALNELKNGEVILLENVRYYKGEEKNDPEFVKELAKLFDVYINDAFGTCHRKHASVYGAAELIDKKGAGFLVEKEAAYFDKLIKNPEKPFAAIIGGAKVSDKIGVIKSLLSIADIILIGGAMAYSFLKYKGISVGTSLVEDEQMGVVADVLAEADKKGVKILLPIDHIISDKFDGSPKECDSVAIPDGYMGLDIGNKTRKEYASSLEKCKTVLWNGPMGVFENPDYAKGTFFIAEKLASLGVTVVVGGGDSVSAVKKSGVADKISHISTGGGASLEYIEFGTLPGIDILR